MRLVSTPESIDSGEITLLAIFETLLAVTLLIVLSIWIDPVKWLAGACAIAPLLLLRTKDSLLMSATWSVLGAKWMHVWLAPGIICSGVGSTLLCYWIVGWWTPLVVILLGGSFVFTFFPIYFFVIRVGATAITAITHPVKSVFAIPENWRRVVLATDSHTPPEFIPGADRGPLAFLDRWEQEDVVGRWLSVTFVLGVYPIAAAYRWSVKATCLIYLPLVWLVNKAKFTPGSMQQTLEDYLEDDIQWVRRMLAPLAMVALALKITLLWYVNDAAVWLKENAPEWLLKILRDWDHYIVPHQVPLWQIAPAVNGILAVGLWLYARRVLYLKERAPAESTVLAVWRTVTTLSLLFSLYTIACTVLITWKAGHLTETLSRLWSMIGKQLFP